MTEQHVDIESIFDRAVEIDALEARQAYLDEACGGDKQLRRRVEALLRASNDAGSFLEKPPEGLAATIAGAADDTVDEALDAGSLSFLAPSDKPGCVGTLAQYEVVDIVGRGGMGIVLRAYDTKLNRVVAIKVMAPELAANPMAVKRFLREARAAAAVSHDHVVTIHAIEEDNRPPFIVMEFVDGQSLQEKIDRDGALELDEILRIGLQMARGLAAAHEQGLVHRDIKPANILLENGVERVKLTDFGLARAVDDVSVTQTGQIAGTPQFMSPEQAQGHALDARSDLFSLGSVLYAMCTGRPPFRAETPLAMLRRVTDDDPRSICEVNADIPEWLEAIVFKLLAKVPAERFRSATEVAELLSQHLAHLQHPAITPMPDRVVPPIRHAGLQSEEQSAPKAGYKFARWSMVPLRLTVGLLVLTGLATLAAVFYIVTDKGTLVIETNDPGVRVVIENEGETVKIVDIAINGDSDVRMPFVLRSGKYELRPLGDESVEISQDSVTLKRGDRVVVRVTKRPLADQASGERTKPAEGEIAALPEDENVELTEMFAIQTKEGLYWRSGGAGEPVIADSPALGLSESFVFEWENSDRTQAYIRTHDGTYLRGRANQDHELFTVDERDYTELFGLYWVDQEQKTFELRAVHNSPVRVTRGRGLDLNGGSGEVFTLVPIQGRRAARYPSDHIWQTGLIANQSTVQKMAFAADGRLFTVGAKNQFEQSGLISVWDTTSGTQTVLYHHSDPIEHFDVARDANFAVTGDRAGNIQIWDLADTVPAGEAVPTAEIKLDTDHLAGLAISADGLYILTAHETVTLWRRGESAPIRQFEGSNPSLNTVTLTPNGQRAVGIASNGSVYIWEVETGKLSQQLRLKSILTCVSISPDGRHAMIGAGNSVLDVDLETGQDRQIFREQSGFYDISTIAFFPGGEHIVCGGSRTIRVLSTATGTEVRHVETGLGGTGRLAVSPNGHVIASAGGDRMSSRDSDIHLWQLPESVWPDVASLESRRMTFVLIPAGEFVMGTAETDRVTARGDWFFADFVPDRREAETPEHRVTISKPFEMSTHEVTVGQFRQFVESTGHKTTAEQDGEGYGWRDGEWQDGSAFNWRNPGFEQTEVHPVCNVSWEDATEFCRWLSEKEGAAYRLPTEAEWEYACRAGATTLFSTGDDPNSLQGAANLADATLLKEQPGITWAVNWDDGFAATAPVGSFKPNAFGLHDMHGNVWEWCQDVYDDQWYETSPATDPVRRGSGRHVFRGGGFDNWPGFLRSADRYSSHSATIFTDWAGFRVVREFATPEPREQGGNLPVERPASGTQEPDRELIQGTWNCLSAITSGKELPNEQSAGRSWAFAGETFFEPAIQRPRRGKFVLDTATDPKQIDLHIPAEQDGFVVIRGIYELKGDRLTICIQEDFTAVKRPTDFTTVAGDKRSLLVFQRATDQELLQGTWQVVALEGAGQTAPANSFSEKRFLFEGDRLSLTGVPEDLHPFRLNAASAPKQIDIGSGVEVQFSKAIYELEGDTLRLCLSQQTRLDRPKDFDTEGTRYFCFTLKRVEQ